jgi:hypothetical protein
MANENVAADATEVNLVDRLIQGRKRPGDRFDNDRSKLLEEALAAKAGILDSLARDIWALERRVAALEEDRNRRDELDAIAAAVPQRMRD